MKCGRCHPAQPFLVVAGIRHKFTSTQQHPAQIGVELDGIRHKTWVRLDDRFDWITTVIDPPAPPLLSNLTCQAAGFGIHALMAPKRRTSGDGGGGGKASKASDPKLPSIPADSARMKHMKLFNEWLTFSSILSSDVQCAYSTVKQNGFSPTFKMLQTSISSTQGCCYLWLGNLRCIPGQATGFQGQLPFTCSFGLPSVAAGRSNRVLQGYREALPTR